MIETIFLCTIFGVFILIAYSSGLKNGQKLINREEIKVIEPIIEKNIEKKEEEEVFNKEQDELMQVLQNIETYDGTSKGQKKVMTK